MAIWFSVHQIEGSWGEQHTTAARNVWLTLTKITLTSST